MPLFDFKKKQPGKELPVNGDTVKKAEQILRKYKEGKQNLEARVKENEQFWKLKQWELAGKNVMSTSWLWNCIVSKHADIMDGYPAPNIVAKQRDDVPEAKRLSSVIPAILDNNNFYDVFSDVSLYTLKNGVGVYSITWDAAQHNGLGDIRVGKVDILNLFWKPGITDIQESPNVFVVSLVDNDMLVSTYPQLEGKVGAKNITLTKYIYDDNVDTSDMSIVVDWYYKRSANGRTVLHFCKFSCGEVLYATENEVQPVVAPDGTVLKPAMAEAGLYDHGKYPFVVQSLFPIEGSIAGYGYIDVGKNAQMEIDLMNNAMLKNTIVNCKPRWFVRKGYSINLAQYADMEQDFVECDSTEDTNLRQITAQQMSSVYENELLTKIQELKETTGNRDVNNGGTVSGVTAGTAIASLQESGAKLSRNTIKSFYNSCKEVTYFVIELIRQFYDFPRWFRIAPDVLGTGDPAAQYILYDNKGVIDQEAQGYGGMVSIRRPEFDITVSEEKKNEYKRMEMNELALNFYQQGFFNPMNAPQALAAIDMMEFDRKDEVIAKILQNVQMGVPDIPVSGGVKAGKVSQQEEARQLAREAAQPR